MTKTIRIYGEISGPIWMPAVECTKDFDLLLERIPRNRKTCTYPGIAPRSMEITCLRDALLHVTNDGDFQSAAITYAVLEVTVHRPGRRFTRRVWELRSTGENADCFVA